MTLQQLHGTHLLSDLLVLMLKDARSNDPSTADDAREWLNAPPLEGMASLQRTCEQLAAAEQSLTDELGATLPCRTDYDWLTAIREAQQDTANGAYRLEIEVSNLLTRCERIFFKTPIVSSGHEIVEGHSPPEDNDPSPSNNSPTF